MTPEELLTQSKSALRAAARISGPKNSYRKDNPNEYVKVMAYWDGGERPAGVMEFSMMGQGLVLEEDARRLLDPVPPVGDKLRDKPPGYPDYVGYTTVTLGTSGLTLDDSKDYRVDLGHLTVPGGPVITGGRNVVLIGGKITLTGIPGQDYNIGLGLWPRTDASHHYIEGVRIEPVKDAAGKWTTMLHDGIAMRGPKGKVTIQNCRIGPTCIKISDTIAKYHADSLQFQNPSGFAGDLRVDKITSLVDYTGIMASEMFIRSMNLRRWNFVPENVNPNFGHHIALYANNTSTVAGITLEDFWWVPRSGSTLAQSFVPQSLGTRPGVHAGIPPDGDYVPEGVAGTSYVSPGYL